MTFTRVIAGATLGLAALLVTACSSAGSNAASGGASSGATSSATSVASSPAAPPTTPSAAASTAAASPTAAPSAPAQSSASQTAAETFIASGQTLTGTPLYEPSCGGTYGCQLSGDSTAFLTGMTWQSWTTTEAIGSGIEKIASCNPNCAAGTVYPVSVVVTFTQPVKACVNGAAKWYWTRASFSYPKGLPSALQGDNAPANPWNFTALSQSATQSCA
jgi:hypothetical protein